LAWYGDGAPLGQAGHGAGTKLVGDLEREFLDGIEHLLAKPLDQRREQRLAELSRKQPSELTTSEREELLQLLRPLSACSSYPQPRQY